MTVPKLELRISGERVMCAQIGCDTQIGRVSLGRIFLGVRPGEPWYPSDGVLEGRRQERLEWRRAKRNRRPEEPALPSPLGWSATIEAPVEPGDVVVCRCNTKQRVPVVMSTTTG